MTSASGIINNLARRLRRIEPGALAAFAVALLVFGAVAALSIRSRARTEQTKQERLILDTGARVQEVIGNLLYKTRILAALTIRDSGGVEHFQAVARAIADDPAILGVVLAPDGVVSDVYPREGQEAVVGLNFFTPGPGNLEAAMAKERGQLMLGGPFTLAQGGQGLVGRLPVWVGAGADSHFWGIVAVSLKYPEAFARVDLDSLTELGHSYEIWRINPDDNRRQTIAGTPNLDKTEKCIARTISIFNADWHFLLGPAYSWPRHASNWGMLGLAFLGALLIADIVQHNLRLKDMTAKLEKKEREVRRGYLAAQEANRVKSTFLANMSHELRTPMNGIIGLADIALDIPGPAPVRGHLAKIKTSAEGLLGIINDVMDVSRIDTGAMTLEAVPFELHDVFTSCERMTRPRARDKGVDLHFYAEPLAGARLVGDPARLRQVLVNLVDNAVKFTNNGSVKVKATPGNRRDDAVDIHFEVKDSGIGMTEREVRRIFDPFVQADSGRNRKYGGAGLGLTICRHFVEAMGGRLEAESAPGLGSRFHFDVTFPVVPAPEAAAAAERPPDSRPLFSGEVLVCEDNSINQDVIVENLARAGLHASLAENGRIGVDMIRRRQADGMPFDLILMDIHMPEMDGIEAARKIVEMGVKTPIVALTANVMAEDRAAYSAIGMAECLGKPFQPHELWACLERFLNPVEYVPLNRPPVPQPQPAAAPAPVRSAGIPILDQELGLRRAAGNAKLYQRVLRNFVRDNGFFVKEIRAALTAGDIRIAHRKAHTLKGVAALIGADPLSQAAAALEDNLRDNVDRHEEEQLAELQEELDAVLEAVKPILAKPRPEPRRKSAPGARVASVRAGSVRAPNAPSARPRQRSVRLSATPTPSARQKINSLLDRLTPLLESGDTESLELLAEATAILAPLGKTGERVVEHIENYDFGAALAEIARLRHRSSLRR